MEDANFLAPKFTEFPFSRLNSALKNLPDYCCVLVDSLPSQTDNQRLSTSLNLLVRYCLLSWHYSY